MVGKEVDNILNGPGSFYADGVQKDAQTLLSDLVDFMGSIQDLRGVVNDRSNILNSVVDDLKSFTQTFENRLNANEPHDDIQLKPDASPNTEDNNILNINPNIDPKDSYPNSNPLLPQNRPKYQDASLKTPQRDAAYFPRASAFAATPSPSALNGSALSPAPRTAGDVQALAQRIARMLGGAGRFIGNRLVSPAEAAFPSAPMLRGATAPDASSAPPIADPGSNGALGAEADATAPSIANKDFRYLTRNVADRPQASVFDTGAPAVPFVPDGPDFSGGLPSLPVRFLTRVDPRNPGQAALPQQTARPLGIVSGEPMPDWPFPPPIFDFPRKSVATNENSEDRLERLLRGMGIY